MTIVDNPDKDQMEGRPFRIREDATGKLSVEAFFTRKSAKHAMKQPVKFK